MLNEAKKQIHPTWWTHLSHEFKKDYMLSLNKRIEQDLANAIKVFPPKGKMFSAFSKNSLNDIKVVIIGQDPYHGENQAHGLSFSVEKGQKIPPSLKNIYKEMRDDLGLEIPDHGFLKHWDEQGVLLLNAVLSVQEKNPGSHQKIGWEQFTDKVVELLNQERESLVFVLWGAYAQKKGENIDREKHLVLESPHPSPFSARRGFFGSKVFSKINDYLVSKNQSAIDWQIS
ncbi:MAG: uracil-DNA glycosylase [Bdellovibrionaceae bacterium]|nr:uracil-DNA glycosylase [Pseudobdellovibrionaceae bacterium]|tara:strand:+ start:69831 stop:70517 length:687 start_codon:yes stop_codon:yes gene_type:complete